MLETAVLMFQINQADFGRAAAEVPIIRSAHREKGTIGVMGYTHDYEIPTGTEHVPN